MTDDDKTDTYQILTNGTEVAQYRILEKIGAGGMGEVYLADDKNLDRRVALKFLPQNLAAEKEVKYRFIREAKAAAKIHHPHIITIFEVGEFNNRPFIAMEYVEGNLLNDFAKRDILQIDLIIEYAIQLSQGLSEIHRAGIVHRDIKPANIVIDQNNRLRLLDFGLAMVQGGDKLTKTGSTLGTVSYMSPEQVSGREVDKRSDLFSLGIILYELIAGKSSFKRDNDGATLKAILEDTPEPLARFRANVPELLQRVISKLLEKDKEVRYQSAEDVLADLKKLLYDSQSSSYPSSKPQKVPYKSLYFKMVAVSVFLITVIGYMYFYLQPKQEAKNIPVLVVLPFENLGSTEDDYFAEGISEEISSRLLSTVKGLRVISPRSASKYKKTDKSIQQIGEETGAEYILEATIRWDKSGEVDRVKVTPRLTKTSDNYLMWANNYEEKLVEIFSVQSKIAEQIVVALGLTLVETNKAAPEDAPTTNMAAYSFYLKGLEISSHTFRKSDFSESIKMYDSAIALDPSFALAWAQKSISHSTFNFFFTNEEVKYHKSEALRAAEKSIELNPNLPSAKIAMGTYHNFIERDYDKALTSLYSAKSEMTSNADLSQAIGIVKMRQGKWHEALLQFEEAVRIDPLNHQRYYYLSNSLSMTRDYDEAAKYINRAIVLGPRNEDAAYMKILVNLLQYGTLDYGDNSFDKLSHDVGIAEISTYELASFSALGLWRFVIDRIDPQEAIADVRKLGSVRGTITERSLHLIQLNIAQIYDLIGHHDSALIHLDSSRIILDNIIDQGDYEFHAFAELGLTYALMGRKEEAIEAGRTAKELMSVDDCHW